MGLADQLTAIHRAGVGSEERNWLSNPYLVRDFIKANEPHKAPERERVGDFLSRHHEPDALLYGLTLPGLWWRLENALSSRSGGARWIGVERSWEIAKPSVRAMPGGRSYGTTLRVREGAFHGWTTERAMLFHGDLRSLLSVSKASFANKDRYRSYVAEFRQLTCAWIDLLGGVDPSVLDAIFQLQRHFRADVEACPLVVTMILGRGDLRDVPTLADDPVEKRVALVQEAVKSSNLRTFEPLEAWVYKSVGGCPMLTIAGVCRAKTVAASELVEVARDESFAMFGST